LGAERGQSWRPAASMAVLRRRAQAAAAMREYFAETGALEVHTPLLMPSGSTDPALNNFVAGPDEGAQGPSGYLQSSPEFAMKRLLAAGSGDIYQLGPAFRAEESGRHHLAEFTLLEWYRVGRDHHALMDDVEQLVTTVLPELRFTRARYADLFARGYGVDVHTTGTPELAEIAHAANVHVGGATERAVLLDALFADLFLRTAPAREALFVYDFPTEQSAYARIQPGPPRVASRFELIIGGIEIANGYHELIDAKEQAERMASENRRRAAAGQAPVPSDPDLLDALAAGLPDCAGVALGFDRLLMLMTDAPSIAAVSAFAPYHPGVA